MAKKGEGADQSANQVATVQPSTREVVLPGGEVLTIKKIVTAPLLQQKPGATVYVQFLTKIEIGKAIDEKGKPAKEPPHLARVRSLVDPNPHAEYDYIVPAVLNAELVQNYPDASYIGKRFAVTKSPEPVAGKRYFAFGVAELA